MQSYIDILRKKRFKPSMEQLKESTEYFEKIEKNQKKGEID